MTQVTTGNLRIAAPVLLLATACAYPLALFLTSHPGELPATSSSTAGSVG